MGISRGSAKVLLKEASRRAFEGRVLTLGRQDVLFSWEELEKIAAACAMRLLRPTELTVSTKPHLAAKNDITDVCFFRALGFAECRSADCSDYESADFVFDLNAEKQPADLADAFNVVFDGGTLEHVFHLPNALRNVHRMLRTGGRVIHIAPSSNYMDHGFFMFSPTLFCDYYSANRYEINTLQIIRHTQDYDGVPWEICDYEPGCLDQVSFGGLDDAMYAIACIATKTAQSTGDRVPQQRTFQRLWDQNLAPSDPPAVPVAPASEAPKSSLLNTLRGAVKKRRLLYKILKPVVDSIRSLRTQSAKAPPPPAPPPKGLRLKVKDYY